MASGAAVRRAFRTSGKQRRRSAGWCPPGRSDGPGRTDAGREPARRFSTGADFREISVAFHPSAGTDQAPARRADRGATDGEDHPRPRARRGAPLREPRLARRPRRHAAAPYGPLGPRGRPRRTGRGAKGAGCVRQGEVRVRRALGVILGRSRFVARAAPRSRPRVACGPRLSLRVVAASGVRGTDPCRRASAPSPLRRSADGSARVCRHPPRGAAETSGGGGSDPAWRSRPSRPLGRDARAPLSRC